MDVAKILNKLENPDYLIDYDSDGFVSIVRAEDNTVVYENYVANESQFIKAVFLLSVKTWFTTHMLYCLLSIMAEKTDWPMFLEIRQG